MSNSANQAPQLRRLKEYPQDAVAAQALVDELLREGDTPGAVAVLAECIAARGNVRTSPNLCHRLGLIALGQALQGSGLGAFLMRHVDDDLGSRLTDLVVLVGGSLSETVPFEDLASDMAS